LKTVEEVHDKTTAGTVCGGCIPDIEEILAERNTEPDYFLSFKISRNDRLKVK
jgi:NAD(P)H-nitrite reductase large subunit